MRKTWKWVIGILLLVAVLITCGIWYVKQNWKPILEEKFKELVQTSSQGLYRIDYDDLDLNIALGNVTLKNVRLTADTSVYQQLVEVQKAPNNRFEMALKSFKIRGVGIRDVLLNRKLYIKRIELDNPQVEITNEYQAYNDTISDTVGKSGFYDKIKEVLEELHVRDINFNNVDINYIKPVKGESSQLNIKGVNVHISDLLIDEFSEQDTSRLYFTKAIELEVPKFDYDLPDEFYRLSFENLKVNTQQKNVTVTNFSFKPKMNKADFFKKKRMNVTMADLYFDTIRIEAFDIKRLIHKNKSYARSLLLKDGKSALSMDKRYPKKIVSKIGQSPHQQLMKMKSIVQVDTIYVDNINVSYSEYSGKYFREGSITFDGATGIMTNVTNDTALLGIDPIVKADLKARIMGQGNLKVQFGFDMLDRNGGYTYKGSVGRMSAPAFNRILKPLLNVEITSGNIKSIYFNMRGTDYRNRGDFKFDYDDLKVSLLDNSGTKVRASRRIASYLINRVIINDSNPDDKGVYHTGKINYKRVPEYSFFKTLWQSLLEGIKQTAGISPEREAKLMGMAENVQTTVEKSKKTVNKTKGMVKGIFRKKDK